jgi:hypothetical protein
LFWSKVEVLFGSCARLIKNWMILSKLEEVIMLETWAQAMEGKKRKTSPPGVETSRTSASLHSEISEESALIPEVMVIDVNSVT